LRVQRGNFDHDFRPGAVEKLAHRTSWSPEFRIEIKSTVIVGGAMHRGVYPYDAKRINSPFLGQQASKRPSNVAVTD